MAALGESCGEAGSGGEAVEAAFLHAFLRQTVALNVAFFASPALEGFLERVEGGAGEVVDFAGEGAAHFEEFGGEDQRHELDGHAEDDLNPSGGGGDDGPAGEVGRAEEDGEHGVKNEHLEEEVFPFFEELFGVGEEEGADGERRDDDEEHDDGLAGGHGEEGREERDEGGNGHGD